MVEEYFVQLLGPNIAKFIGSLAVPLAFVFVVGLPVVIAARLMGLGAKSE